MGTDRAGATQEAASGAANAARSRRRGRRRRLVAVGRGLLVAVAFQVLAFQAPATGSAAGGALPLAATTPVPDAAPELEAALLAASNRARAAAGLPELAQDEGLARAARSHAQAMARLGYFSHGSPDPAKDSLVERLASAGSPLVSVGENIAMLGTPGGAAEAAARAVDGWLASPGHRANLLRPAFDRVGFGSAFDASGRLLVVQDLGGGALTLLSATVVASSRTVAELRLELWSEAEQEVAITLGGGAAPSRRLPAGASLLTLTSVAEQPVQLLAGVGLGDGRFVVQDAGWLDPIASSYRPDPYVPRERLSVTSAQVARRAERGARLTLRYEPPSAGTLALFLGGMHRPEATVSPGVLELFLPNTEGLVTVGVGVAGDGGSVELIHRFHVDASLPFPTLLAGPAPASGP